MPRPVHANSPATLGPDPARHGTIDSIPSTNPATLGDGLDLHTGTNAPRPKSLQALLLAVAKLPRSSTLTGAEPLVNRREVKRLEKAMQEWPKSLHHTLEKLLQEVDTPFAQGLLLRAVAARAGRLKESKALDELQHFAQRLKALSPAELEKRATVLDLHPLENSSDIDALGFWDRRGVIHDRTRNDQDANNDGLFQRFTASCGPTVIQMMLAEADPLNSFAIHQSGIHSSSDRDGVADFQRTLLERFEGIAVGREQASIRSRLKNVLGRLRRYGQLTNIESRAVLDYCESGQKLDGAGEKALRAVREGYGGFPSGAQINVLRGGSAARDAGMTTAGFVQALNEAIGPLTGATYGITVPPNGFARGEAKQHIDVVAKALRSGHDVPFGMQEPAHWLLLSAVKGYGQRRQFLVSDPDGGRTAWVKEADLLNGSFARDQFYLCATGEKPYVDAFVLPL